MTPSLKLFGFSLGKRNLYFISIFVQSMNFFQPLAGCLFPRDVTDYLCHTFNHLWNSPKPKCPKIRFRIDKMAVVIGKKHYYSHVKPLDSKKLKSHVSGFEMEKKKFFCFIK